MLSIIYEDNQILVCEKPAGMPVQSDKSLDPDLVNIIKNHLHQEGKGEPYVGLVHRLDRPVGGVMVFAKTPKAARHLSRQIQEKQTSKTYLCIVTKDLSHQMGTEKILLTDYLKKDGRTNTSKIVPASDKAGKKAELAYTVKAVKDDTSLLEVELYTGRHHQIRVQLSAHAGGILGDTKYNPESRRLGRTSGIALFSNSLNFLHPATNKPVSFSALPSGSVWDAFIPFE